MQLNLDLVKEDLLEAVLFFSKNQISLLEANQIIDKKIAGLNFNDPLISHYGINKLAKKIVSELSTENQDKGNNTNTA